MYKLLLVFCFIFFAAFTGAKTPGKKKVAPPVQKTMLQLQIDTGKVNMRKFNAGSLGWYAKNPDFDYQATSTKPGQSWWDRFWAWFWDLLARLFGGNHASGPSFPFLRFVFYAAVIGVVIFVIVKLAGIDFGNLFNKNSKSIAIPYTESLENIHQVTFDQEIEKALAQRNYKLAIRLLYLSTLKQLNDARLINWQIEKTNSAYLNELADSRQRQSFAVLTRQFEYVWYGNFSIDARSFQHINNLFLDFKKMLP